MIIIEPPSVHAARQIVGPGSTAPLRGVTHPLAPAVMNELRRRGGGPVKLWRVVNSLANARQPRSRESRRFYQLGFVVALRELQRARLVCRHYGWIALRDFVPVKRSAQNVSRPVVRSACEKGGSNGFALAPKSAPTNHQVFETEQKDGRSDAQALADDKISVPPPSREDVTAASSSMGRWQRGRSRPWSGEIEGKRVRRFQRVIVPGGHIVQLYGIRRGYVIVLPPAEVRERGELFWRFRVADVRLYRDPAASLLGSVPPKPDSRPRGRPAKSQRR
jgi:hypothetical protein